MRSFISVTAVLFAVSSLVLSASVSNQEVDLRGIIENTINSTLNKILANLSDTITADGLSVNFDDNANISEYISGGLNASNIRVSGVKSLVATAIKMDVFSKDIALTIRLSEVIASFKYWADFTLLKLVPLYGDGRMNIVLDDIELSINGKANLTGGIKLTNLTVMLSLGESTFDLNGLINNPEFSALVSNALNDNFSAFVNDNAGVISSVLSPVVEAILNSIF